MNRFFFYLKSLNMAILCLIYKYVQLLQGKVFSLRAINRSKIHPSSLQLRSYFLAQSHSAVLNLGRR